MRIKNTECAMRILKEGKLSRLRGGDSGKTYQIRRGPQKYVVKEYETANLAKYYELIHRKLFRYGFLPRLYCRDKNKLVFEYIEGRDCKKPDASEVAFQVGRICAIINTLSVRGRERDYKPLKYALALLRKHQVFSEEDTVTLGKLYRLWKSRAHPEFAIDFHDVYPENFRLRKRTVYLVDIENMEPKFKGRG